ncbi:molecular chaperone [Thermodesulfobacteriota bacterium]
MPLHAFAGSFKTVPLKLYMEAKTKSTNLKIVNTSEETLNLQLKSVKWTQNENGQDNYEPTKDILFFPKMLTIEKGDSQIVRVGYKGKQVITDEQTYRLFVKELPVAKPGEQVLKMALNIGLPVFIKPAEGTIKMSLEEAKLANDMLVVKIKNSGTSHFVVSKVHATGFDASGSESFKAEQPGWYVLPGISKYFSVKIPRDGCLNTSDIKILVDMMIKDKLTDDPLKTEMKVDTALCPKEVKEEEGKDPRKRYEKKK